MAFNGTVPPPGSMFVRALYDYDADDRTSLSFRQGDIIQVITQLESGWWDGVINGVRGWFPSNYCAVVTRADDDVHDDRNGADGDDDTQSDLGSTDYTNSDTESVNGNDTILPIEHNGNDSTKEEEAAFWIPQATSDGRLFYFNTLTGVSTMELPLETPLANESGPRDRVNVFIPDSSRPPAELLASGYHGDDTDDENSASDFEGPGMMGSHSSLVSLPQSSPLHAYTNPFLSARTQETLRRRVACDVNGLHEPTRLLRPAGGCKWYELFNRQYPPSWNHCHLVC
jgi:son of sevenless-like protein